MNPPLVRSNGNPDTPEFHQISVVSVGTPSSANGRISREALKRVCEEHLSGRYDLEVIDIYQQPVLAQGEQIIAAPTSQGLRGRRPTP